MVGPQHIRPLRRRAIETRRAVSCVKLGAGIRVIDNEPRNAKYFRQHQELREAGRTLPWIPGRELALQHLTPDF